MSQSPGGSVRLAVEGVTKRFGAVHALDDVTLNVNVGEVVGLIGENGAGKSTLLGVMSGTVHPDSGRVSVDGQETTLHGYHAATERGIFRIYQHQALVPTITVAENLFLGQERTFSRAGLLQRRRMVRLAQQTFERLGVDGIDPKQVTSRYKFAERQIIEIVRSLAQAEILGVEHPVILLDEPTSALSSEQVEFFSSFVRRVRDQAAQVFVSHRLHELLSLSDRVYVLKDGCNVAHIESPGDTTEAELHKLMVGRAVEETMHRRARVDQPPEGPAVLDVVDATREGAFSDVSFSVHQGEIVGVAGVLGSGKSELGRAVFTGDRELDGGEIRLDGERLHRGGARSSIRRGVGYVPPERHAEGLIDIMSVAKNLSLPQVGAVERTPLVFPGRERQEAGRVIKSLNVKTASSQVPISTLSGGNQQKVILGRWMNSRYRLLILDNPTNGVDVGAKAEIYNLIRDVAGQGVAIFLISDDLPELIGMSDRIHIMRDGRLVHTVECATGQEPTEDELVAHMV